MLLILIFCVYCLLLNKSMLLLEQLPGVEIHINLFLNTLNILSLYENYFYGMII